MKSHETSHSERLSIIRSCEIFSELPESEVEQLATGAFERRYKKRTIVISTDDDSDSVYIVVSGRVRIYRENDQGRQVTLNIHGPGKLFGELAALCDAPRIASVEALEPTTTLVISRGSFLALLQKQPEFAIRLARQFADWVRLLSINVTDLALLDVYGRLARLLPRLAFEEDGNLVIDAMTQQEIANQIGSSREMVGRIMADLKTGNYIEQKGKKIIIKRDLPSAW